MMPSDVPHRSKKPARRHWRMRAWHIISAIVAVILLASAALKVHQLASRPLMPTIWLDQRWTLSVGIIFEIVLAMVLLSRFAPRLTWAVTMVTFAFFAGVSAWKGLLGEASCGCFGVITIWPWYTVALDLTLLALMAVLHPPLIRPLNVDVGDPRLAAAMGLSLLLSVPALWIAASYRPAPLELSATEDVTGVTPQAEFVWAGDAIEHHLGPIFRGSDYEVVIGLRNAGPAALHIETLYCECTCMQAHLLGSPVVDPGQMALVRIVCNIPEDSSDYRKRVLIRSGRRQLVLTVTGDLPPEVWGY